MSKNKRNIKKNNKNNKNKKRKKSQNKKRNNRNNNKRKYLTKNGIQIVIIKQKYKVSTLKTKS